MSQEKKQMISDEATKILKEIKSNGFDTLKEDYNPLQQTIDRRSQSDRICQEFRQVANCEEKPELPDKIMIFNRSEFGNNLIQLINNLNAIGCTVQFECRSKNL